VKVIDDYDLRDRHLALLTMACEACNRAEEARLLLEADGPVDYDRWRRARKRPAVAVVSRPVRPTPGCFGSSIRTSRWMSGRHAGVAPHAASAAQ
jgi:hypothetical protein